ncbi:MAG: hypothetical protein IJ794_09285 [Lachnospiraceae bacterium]|nr:hypothetical protein [Lachnospiraceae bacterium]
MERFNRLACDVVRGIGTVFVGYLFLQGLFTICCIRRVTELTYYMKNDVFRQIIGIVLFGVAVYFLQRLQQSPKLKTEKNKQFAQKYGDRLVLIVLFIVLAAFAVWILITRFWYIGDMEKIYQYAGMILEGDFSGWYPGGYPYEWTQQNALILFVAVLLKLFGGNGSFLVFYFVNLIFYGVALGAIAITLRQLAESREEYVAQSLMVVLYFPFGFLVTMLYGDMIGFAWGCVSMAFLINWLNKRRLVWLICSCISMILAVNFRQNELIFFLGILVILLMDCLNGIHVKPEKGGSGGDNRGWIRPVGSRFALLAIYILLAVVGFSIPDRIIEGVGNVHIEGGNSRWAHVAMGMQESDKAPGWYNNYVDTVFIDSGYDTDTTTKAAKAAIGERLDTFKEQPAYAWLFFHRKLASEWNNPTFECFHIQNSRKTSLELSSLVKSMINDGGKLNILLIGLLDIAQSIVLFGVLMYLICVRTTDLKKMLFMILFIGGFIFFAFWEAKCRYVLPFYLLLIPYAYPGYAAVIRQKRVKTVAVLAAIVLLIGVSDNRWICDAFKLNQNTNEYYEYIHQYDHNFEWFRF